MSVPQQFGIPHVNCICWTLLLFQLASCSIEAHGFGLNLMQVQDEDKSRAACTLALLQKYFHSGDRLSGSVLCVSVTSNTPDVLQQIMNAIHNDPNYVWSILVTSSIETQRPKSHLHAMPEKPQTYFLIVEDLEDEDLEETLTLWRRMLNWNPLAQFVVYLAAIEETDEEMTDLMVEILLTFMNNKLYNVNVFGQSEENTFYYSKTVFPYHPDNNCGNRVIFVNILDACGYEDESQSDDDSEEYLEEGEESTIVEEAETEDISNDSHQSLFEVVTEDLSPVEVNQTDYAISQESLDANETSKASGYPPKAAIEEYQRALFEDKFPSDLNGCPITAAYHGPWEPYIFSSVEESETDMDYYEEGAESNSSEASYGEGSEPKHYGLEDGNTDVNAPDGQPWSSIGLSKLHGIEFQLVQTIAQRLHMTIDFKKKSANVFHLFNLLIEGRVEMIVGGIGEDPSSSQFVSSSTSYHQDDLTWCVAKAKRKHSLFNFMASFDGNAWFLIMLFVIICSLIVLIAERLSNFKMNHMDNYIAIYLRMLGVLLAQPVSLKMRILPSGLRLLFPMAFYLSIFFNNSYQSFLISTLSTPTADYQISELEEIYNNRMIIMVSSENMRHLNKEGEIFRYIREKFEICYNIVDCLNDATDNEHVAVVVSRQHALYNAHIQRDKLFCFDRRESLYVYPVAMLLPKKFHLLHHINAVIHNVIESGHMQKWSRDLDMVRQIQEEIARVQEGTFKALTIDSFRGIVAFGSLLLLVSSLMFASECLIYWLVVNWRTRLRLLRYLHRRLGKRRG